MPDDKELLKQLQEHTTKLNTISDSVGKLSGINDKLGQQSNQLKDINTNLKTLGDTTNIFSQTASEQIIRLEGIRAELTTHTTTLSTINTQSSQQVQKLGGINLTLGEHGNKLENIGKTLDNVATTTLLALNSRGVEVTQLHHDLEMLGFSIPSQEVRDGVFGVGTRDGIFALQTRYALPRTGVLDDTTRTAMARAVAAANTGKRRAEGRLFFDRGQPASNVTLRVYSRGFGGVDKKLGEVQSDANGFYALEYAAGNTATNLEICAVDLQGVEFSLASTKFNADRHEVQNLTVPANKVRQLSAEYDRLTAALKEQLGDLSKLADARENQSRRDLSFLHHATRWDARLIALAAITQQLSKDSDVKLPPQVLYGLLRVGLPSDKRLLAQIEESVVEKALKGARTAGIVQLSDQEIEQYKQQFKSFASRMQLATPVPGTSSTYGELLSDAGIGNVNREQEKFAALYFTHRGDAAQLWRNAKAAGLTDSQIGMLQTQGKLALLTNNNKKLMNRLRSQLTIPARSDRAEVGQFDVQLVGKGFYQDDLWIDEIDAAVDIPVERKNNLTPADRQKLTEIIPPVFVSDTVEQRRMMWAQEMARKVRLSYPTQVTRHMVETGTLRLGERHDALKTPVCTFLNDAAAFGFALGRTPVNDFLKSHGDSALKNVASEDAEATIATVKRLYRLYQITPSDGALKVLLDQGFNSAFDVTAIPYHVFLTRFSQYFNSRDEANLVYRKAQQVTAVTYNLLTGARLLDSNPLLYAISPPALQREKTKENLIARYPTMEALFGSMDFCECEHCRSVLSPAAYFVDLLQFLTPDAKDWGNFLDDWKKKHANQQYQQEWADENPDKPREDEKKKPYYALIARRPDLPYLPLTCENTNTALPYIDVVNEIFEYYVAHGELSQQAVHDTGTATTAELLAEPQNTEPLAYATLQAAVYSLSLPFDLWIETVRCFFNHLGTPLWQVLDQFHTTEDLFPSGGSSSPYGRAAVFTEYLGLSPAEYDLFVNPSPTVNWFKLYGYPTEDEALCEVGRPTSAGSKSCPHRNAEQQPLHDKPGLRHTKTLSRRLGVSYKELIAIVDTNFVNPYLLGGECPLVLKDNGAPSNFDQTYLQFADGRAADAFVFVRINLFVRLRKKLGWTIEEMDRALTTFIPKNASPPSAGGLGNALQTALLYMAHLKALDERFSLGNNSRIKLFTLWADLPTTGTHALYAQLFLTRSVLNNDPVFDHPSGNYLSYFDPHPLLRKYKPFTWDPTKPEDAKTGNVSLNNHLLTLQAVLNLTANEIGQILADSLRDAPPPLGRTVSPEQALAAAPLNLSTVSLLYRYGLFAKALDLSVSDLITLKELSGINPFSPLSPLPVKKLPEDAPLQKTLRFVDIVNAVKNSGFQMEDLNYLLRHHFDPLGKYRPTPEAFLALVKSLAGDIRRVNAEHPLPDHATAITDDVARTTLIQRLVISTMTTSFGSDALLTEALVTDPALLTVSKPALSSEQPRESLLTALTKAADLGVTAEFSDSSGQILGTVMRVTTIDTTTAPPGTVHARFLGYLEVPVAGEYTFSAECSTPETEAELLLGSHPDSILFTQSNPAAKVDLKPGQLYEITLTVRKLQGGSFRLLVPSDTLPKGDLTQLGLYPKASVNHVQHAFVLLTKTLQVITTFGFSEREVRHLLTHPDDFDGLNFSTLPTQEADVSTYNGQRLFAQFLRLANYAGLKRQLAAGTDDLIAILENARREVAVSSNTGTAQSDPLLLLHKQLAAITHRDVATISAAATYLGLHSPSDFAQENNLWRLWRMLQIVEKLGVPVDTIQRWTTIIEKGTERRDAIANDVKNAVKARYSAENWQLIAQPIFDDLRQRRRDALVSYLVPCLGYERQEQLFEHFLIDPGMEPVVQTSRLRLAISSVQLFIQRCFLNLERFVHPSAISSQHWQWMKRYRVWEANRKMFLYPENWLEPEFRDDKTHLFRELESALLQSDVSNDVVENTFFQYLRKMEELARLELVTMYCEEKPADLDANTLHVIGRTYNLPHKYFYRRYTHNMWTPWEPVSAEIEGDHVVAVVWQERLHLFWATFLEKPEKDTTATANLGDDAKAAQIAKAVGTATSVKNIEVQLNWSEYYQGQWTTRESSGFEKPIRVTVRDEFDKRTVLIYASIEEGENDVREAVKIHLSGRNFNDEVSIPPHLSPGQEYGSLERVNNTAFRIRTKYSQPGVTGRDEPREIPYVTSRAEATHFTGANSLQFVSPPTSRSILSHSGEFSLLPCGNVLDPVTTTESKSLSNPFFYQDNQYTFFVEPTQPEPTLVELEDWLPRPPKPEIADIIDTPVTPQEPVAQENPEISDPGAPYAYGTTAPHPDWVTDVAIAIEYGDTVIGQQGGISIPGQDVSQFGTTAQNLAQHLIIVGPGGFHAGIASSWHGRK